MAKSIPPDSNGELLRLLVQMNEKISSARVLNGGFDRLEKQVTEIKSMQEKLSSDFQNHVQNDDRIEMKIDRLYDPEEGIYAKVNKTQVMVETLSRNVNALTEADTKFASRLQSIEDVALTAATNIKKIEKISGDDFKDLVAVVKTNKGLWKFALWAGAGTLTAIAKLLWDLFAG